MSSALCPLCKNKAQTKISQSENNPNRAYYICPQCPSNDGKGKKFLGWVDGEPSQKKRKVEEIIESSPPPEFSFQTPLNNASNNVPNAPSEGFSQNKYIRDKIISSHDKLESVIDFLERLSPKIDQILAHIEMTKPHSLNFTD